MGLGKLIVVVLGVLYAAVSDPATLSAHEGDKSSTKAAEPRREGEVAKEKLRGLWKTEGSTFNGKERPEEKDVTLEFRGDQLLVHEPAHADASLKLSVTLDHGHLNVVFPPTNRGYLDLTNTVWARSSGIYAVQGDTLTICIQSAYSIPKDFSDKDQVRWVLKRKR